MSEYWEPIRDRGNATNSIWEQYNPTFMVGQIDLAGHLANVAAIEGMVQERDDEEDLYNQAIDAKDANLQTLARLNVRAVSVIRGNLEPDDPLALELKDVGGMPNQGTGKIMARGRKLSTLWKKVNTARAALEPPLGVLDVGGTLVAAVDAALTANEPLLKAVSDALTAWNASRGAFRALIMRVDRNNKRWYEAWSGYYEVGSVERDALSQIDTGPGAVALPGVVTFTLMHDPASGRIHIDATADHATHFREWRKGPGEDEYVERAANAVSPLLDPVTLPGVYDIKLQARNSSGDGPVSAVLQVTVPE